MSLLFNPTDGKNRRRFRENVRRGGNKRGPEGNHRKQKHRGQQKRVKYLTHQRKIMIRNKAKEKGIDGNSLITIMQEIMNIVGKDIAFNVALITTISLLSYMAQHERKFLSANHTVPTLELPVVQEAVMPYLYQEQLRQGVLQEVPEQTVKEVGGALNLLITAAGTAAGAIGSVVGAMFVIGSAATE